MTVYAKQTTVSVAKSRAEIEELLTRYGADSFATGWKGDQSVVGFTYRGRAVRFELPLPARSEPRFWHDLRVLKRYGDQAIPSWAPRRSEHTATASWEQECRSRWRALLLVIKAKLEAVETGITTFDQEFLAHFVLPGTGQTVHQVVLPRLQEAYERGGAVALLPETTS